jgi:hypothetical protein
MVWDNAHYFLQLSSVMRIHCQARPMLEDQSLKDNPRKPYLLGIRNCLWAHPFDVRIGNTWVTWLS